MTIQVSNDGAEWSQEIYEARTWIGDTFETSKSRDVKDGRDIADTRKVLKRFN